MYKNTSKQTVCLRIASWLDDSPVKKVFVAGAAIFAFVLSLLNSGFSAWKEYQAYKKIPIIKIHSRTSYSITDQVNMSQIMGSFPRTTTGDNLVNMPYFPVVVEMSNPTGQRTSLSNCALRVEFYQRQGTHSSMSYMQKLEANNLEENSVLPIESGETKRVELQFFFLPTAEFQNILNDRSTQPHRFRISCRNEAGNLIESRIF